MAAMSKVTRNQEGGDEVLGGNVLISDATHLMLRQWQAAAAACFSGVVRGYVVVLRLRAPKSFVTIVVVTTMRITAS
jgi:hypothetical protein